VDENFRENKNFRKNFRENKNFREFSLIFAFCENEKRGFRFNPNKCRNFFFNHSLFKQFIELCMFLEKKCFSKRNAFAYIENAILLF
jgi:hypothetical protein